MQQEIRDLRVDHRGKPLGPITASFGLAAFPDHGPADRLLRTADAALLRAKREGRDRIVIAAARDGAASEAAYAVSSRPSCSRTTRSIFCASRSL